MPCGQGKKRRSWRLKAREAEDAGDNEVEEPSGLRTPGLASGQMVLDGGLT